MKNLWIFTIVFTLLSSHDLIAQGGLRSGNVPINFYARVIDQNGKPIPGAMVEIGVIVFYPSTYSSEQKKYSLETDKNGQIALNNANGGTLDILSIEKDGYELSQKAERGFVYNHGSDTHSDPKRPAIFRMWKKQGKEPLVSSRWRGKVACDGATHRFDLSKGQPSPDGDLEVICTRIPVHMPPANIKPYSYKLQIAIIGGGIQATADEFTYLAPENGYFPSLTFGQTADDPKWDRRTPIPKEYYIKTAAGHYGQLSLNWDLAAQSPTYLEWDCFINPSGSRNLER